MDGIFRRSRFVFAGLHEFITEVSARPWIPVDNTIGASHTSASGIPAGWALRRDTMIDLTLRVGEEEWTHLLALIYFGQSAQQFTWYPDADEGIGFSVYLDEPAAGERWEPTRIGEYLRMFEVRLLLRNAPTTETWLPYFDSTGFDSSLIKPPTIGEGDDAGGLAGEPPVVNEPPSTPPDEEGGPPEPPPIPPPPGGGANEPAGMVAILQQPFDNLNAGGMTWYYGNVQIVNFGVDNVARVGNGPGQYYGYGGYWEGPFFSSGAAYRRMYMRILFRPEPFWRAHFNGYKVFYPTFQSTQPEHGCILELDGSGSLITGSLHFRFLPQSALGSQSLYTNMAGSGVIRDQWNSVELYMELNTPGTLNGVVRWWVNNVLEGEYTNVGFASSAEAFPYWHDPRLVLFAGGGPDPVALFGTQYIYLNDFYISVAQ